MVSTPGAKLSSFFYDAHNFIKDRSDKVEIQEDLEQDTNEPTWNLQIVKDVKGVLGAYHFELVTTLFVLNKKGELQRKATRHRNLTIFNVADVLEIIRNKHEHNHLYEDTEKRSLGWFVENANGVLHFDEGRFGNYWNDKFPNLGLLVWTKLHTDVGVLEKYYISSFPPTSLKPHNFYTALNSGLEFQKNKGLLFLRYQLESTKFILEFHIVPHNFITCVLQGIQALTALPNGGGYNKCTWYADSGPVIEMEHGNKVDTSFEMCLIISSTICEVNLGMVINITKQLDSLTGKKLFLLLSNDFNNSAEDRQHAIRLIENFSHTQNDKSRTLPLSFVELTRKTQNNILRSAKVEIQRKIFLLADLFSEELNTLEIKVLPELMGDLLNQVLRGETIQILKRLDISDVPTLYIQREIKKRIFLKLPKRDQLNNVDKYVIKCFSKESMLKIMNLGEKKIIDVSLLRDIFVISPDQSTSSGARSTGTSTSSELREILDDKNYHFLIHKKDDVFKWIRSIGSTKIFDRDSFSFDQDSKVLLATEFVESLSTFRKAEKLVLISDEPGKGKSFFLQSAAHKVSTGSSNVIVVKKEFKAFLSEIQKVDSIDILTAVLRLVSSHNNFEEKLLLHLLNCRNHPVKFEIMLDALDEVPQQSQLEALSFIKILVDSPLISRVWVTFRKHMLDEIAEKFQSYGYKLLPFSEDQQMEFLIKNWSLYCKSRGKDLDENSENLQNFAKNLLGFTNNLDEKHISGIPLLCKMLAGIYEKQVFEGTLENVAQKRLSLVDIYNELLEKKFADYAEQKNAMRQGSQDYLLENLRLTFDSVHVYFAIKLLFSDELAKKFKLHLAPPRLIPSPEKFVANLGIFSTVDPLKCVHLTFAEFILAKFVFMGITNQFTDLPANEEPFKTFFWKHILDAGAQKFFEVVYMKKLSHASGFRHQITCQFLDKLLKAHFNGKEMSFQTLEKKLSNLESVEEDFVFFYLLDKISPRLAATQVPSCTHLLWLMLAHINEATNLFFYGLMCRNIDFIRDMSAWVRNNRTHIWGLYSIPDIPEHTKFHDVLSRIHDILDQPVVGTMDTIKGGEKILRFVVKEYPTLLHLQNIDGETPLHVVAKNLAVVTTNMKDDADALFLSSIYQDSLMQLLVDLGANPLTKNAIGQNAFDLAVVNKRSMFLILNLKAFQDYLEKTSEAVDNLLGNSLLHFINEFIPIFLGSVNLCRERFEKIDFDLVPLNIYNFAKFVWKECPQFWEETEEYDRNLLLNFIENADNALANSSEQDKG